LDSARRKSWLDWQRGLAVLFMVEVHVLDAWLAPGARHGELFHALRFLGGFAAPGFLYMAGLSQALGDAALARRGVDARERRRLAVRRALGLLAIAYGFRFAEFVAGGAFLQLGGIEDVLRVDILNVIAVSMLLSAVLSIGRGSAGPLVAAGAAVAIVLFTPVVAAWPHPPSRLLDYVHGSWPRANFHLFNWSAFLLAGAAVGPLAVGPRRPGRFLLLGAGLVALGLAADRLPDVYAHQSFWRTSPAWFLIRLGICAGLTGALQLAVWPRAAAPRAPQWPQAISDAAERGLRWLSFLGRESLVAYLASTELTYGVLATPVRKALTLPTAIAGMVAMTGLTWAVCTGWARLRAWRAARDAAPLAPAGS
jgi:uncharacterized membrane protein